MTYTCDEEIERQVIERMGQMFQDYSRVCAELHDIRTGKSVVLPRDMEHAKFMVAVGQHYISETHKETIKAIKQGN